MNDACVLCLLVKRPKTHANQVNNGLIWLCVGITDVREGKRTRWEEGGGEGMSWSLLTNRKTWQNMHKNRESFFSKTANNLIYSTLLCRHWSAEKKDNGMEKGGLNILLFSLPLLLCIWIVECGKKVYKDTLLAYKLYLNNSAPTAHYR